MLNRPYAAIPDLEKMFACYSNPESHKKTLTSKMIRGAHPKPSVNIAKTQADPN